MSNRFDGKLASAVMDYDPNMVYSGRMANQQVRLTFGLWDYRNEMTVTVGGNCQGLTVIEAATENAYEMLFGDEEDDASASIVLTRANGDRLLCEDDNSECENWLKNMLIAAEIVSITADHER